MEPSGKSLQTPSTTQCATKPQCILKQLIIREYQLRPSPLECGMHVNFFCLQKREAWALGIRKKAEGTQGYSGGIDA